MESSFFSRTTVTAIPSQSSKNAVTGVDDEPPIPKSRFDWRQRALSRVRKKPDSSIPRKGVFRRKPPLTEVRPGEPYYGAIQSYTKNFMELLEAEEAEDEAVLTERLATWSLDRLIEEGYCLTVASFLLGPGIILPENRLENGTSVLVSRIDPLQEQPMRGSVISRTSSQIRICFPEHFDLDEGAWRLDLGRPNLVFERMRTAVSHMNLNPQTIEEEPITDNREHILHGTHLRDILLRAFQPDQKRTHRQTVQQAPDNDDFDPTALNAANARKWNFEELGAFKDDMRIQSWAMRYAQTDPIAIDGDPPLDGLNHSQTRAMATMIKHRFSLVQGPPGTGKTKTIIETVKLLKVHFEVPHPILVCTYTNVAVDNLVEGLVGAGVKALRVGFGGSIKESLRPYSLDTKLEQHRLQPTLKALVKEKDKLQAKMEDLETRLRDVQGKVESSSTGRLAQREQNMKMALISMQKQFAVTKAKVFSIQQEMLREVVGAADAICTTCITSACMALNVTDFPVVFLDEASMSTEPASLIPIMKGSRHVALIGDHKQLPPVIVSREAQALGLGMSLFERLTGEAAVPSVMLDVQYRMHPAISRFPSHEFYNRALQDGTVDVLGNAIPRLSPPNSHYLRAHMETGARPSIIFLDHAGDESVKDRSRINRNEAYIVVSVVEDLMLNNPHLRGSDIGIIAPYVAQISLLTRLFNTDPTYQARFKEVLGDHRAMQLPHIEIKTVDGFEGREKEVIIFSTVRNNTGGYIGFLADRRRLNVGLTRAKRGLIVVGSINTLKSSKMSGGEGENAIIRVGKGAESWRRYAHFLTERGLVFTLHGETLQRALNGKRPNSKFRLAKGMRPHKGYDRRYDKCALRTDVGQR